MHVQRVSRMGNWLESAWPVVCTAMMGTSCMSSTPRGGSHVQIHVVDKGVALATLLYERSILL